MISISLVGKPNAGKSTFFKAATLRDVEISPRPFTTIKPNVGVGHTRVECPHPERAPCSPRRGSCFGGKRFVPVPIKDVAGLVPGAHEGRGLGNRFLDDAMKSEAILVVLDGSGQTDREGNPGEGSPLDDLEFLEEEFDLWLEGILRRHTDAAKAVSGLGFAPDAVEEALSEASNSRELARTLRMKGKKWVLVLNKADLGDVSLKPLERRGYTAVPASALLELALRAAAQRGLVRYVPGDGGFEVLREPTEAEERSLEFARRFLKKFGSTGVQRAVDELVRAAGYFPVFPVENCTHWTDSKGNVLPDCLLMKKGSTARELAYAIHTDIGDRFARAVDCSTGKALGAEGQLEPGSIVRILTRR